ncbi:MAG: class B sortase, partial [Clostridiales bacterium]|nr:class B sortase [Clostridiales bacterium]
EYAQPEVIVADHNESPVVLETDDPEEVEEEAVPVEMPPAASPPRDPVEVNGDYIGWLKINGTVINYPMVRGQDNEKYLKTSFEGQKNGLGAVFMDYRCSGDFCDHHSIIYAHNAKNGSMFGSLSKYLDADYLEKHREITITLPNGEKETWRIFAARKSDITDHAYRIVFSTPENFAVFAESLEAPAGTNRILTLSTCTTGGGDDERMLVHAAILEYNY